MAVGVDLGLDCFADEVLLLSIPTLSELSILQRQISLSTRFSLSRFRAEQTLTYAMFPRPQKPEEARRRTSASNSKSVPERDVLSESNG